jgi:hypothetical protein
VALDSLLSEEPEYGSGARAIERVSPSQPRYIRITDFGDDGIGPNHEFASPDPVEQACALEKDDLLFARSGATVGKTYLHEDTSEAAIFAGYCIRFRIAQSRALPRFVYWFTKTRVYELWVLATQRPAGQPNINMEEYKRLEFPLPNITKQTKLVAAMDAARAERRAKLAEADALLAGLDDFLLATLGLTPPPKDDRKVFAATLKAVRGRADADFQSPRFRTIREGIESGKFPAKPLAELCSRFESGFAAGKQDQAFDYLEGVPHLRPLNLSAEGELSLENTKFVPKSAVGPGDFCERNEVLFNNTNSAEMVGKSGVFEFDQPCACSNHMTRLRAAHGVNPYYLAAVFNMFRRFGYFSLLATKFNNQAGINLDTLKPLRLPAPPPRVQETIAAEARRRREEVRRLRAEAEAGWQAAKRWFEEQLLGPAQP